MRVVIFILSVFLAQGCAFTTDFVVDYSQARTITERVWEKVVAPLPYECYAFARSYSVVEVGIACDDPTLVGCVHHNNKQPFRRKIEIKDGRLGEAKVCTMAHEVIHVLGMCIGNSDHDHENHLYWKKYGTDTVEAMACAEIVYEGGSNGL